MSETPTTVVKPKYASATWYYQNVPSYREKVIQWTKESIQRKRAQDPEGFNEKAREYIKNKYHEDEAYRERQKTRARERYHNKKAEKVAMELEQAVHSLSIDT
jgi:hypothetical protein